ncbi:actin depolymerizing protein [Agrocybe pediades]|nr:actin depolymerizing protein [Agrocybe pediades]
MSALSGITASPDLASAFANAVQSTSTRFIKISIRNESLVHDLSIPITGAFEDDLSKLQDDQVLLPDTPAYVLAKLDLPSSDWLAISYVPDTAQVRDKMLYASTRLPLLRSLGSTLFTDALFATSKDDLTPEAYAAHLRHAAAPNPLSKREQEIADLRVSESKTASYEGSNARASHVGTGVGFAWSGELEEALTALGQGKSSAVVVTTIDPDEKLVLYHAGDVEANSLSSSLPSSDPCYAFFAWPHDEVCDIIFIYSCPSTSSVKYRMLYSTGTLSTYQAAQRILSSLSPAISLHPRKIETSDPKELSEQLLKEELGVVNEEVKDDAPKRFAKPKGPPRRR